MTRAAAPFNPLSLPLADAIVMATASATYCLHPCGPLDAAPLSDFTDSHLHKDYFFRLSHWREKLADPQFQVYSLSELAHEHPDLLFIQGIAITYRSSRLLNLYLAAEIRNLGIGALLIEALAPDEIRSKTNMSQGDPTQWYVRQGYNVLQEKAGKNGTITLLRRATVTSSNPYSSSQPARPKLLRNQPKTSGHTAPLVPLHPRSTRGADGPTNGPPDEAAGGEDNHEGNGDGGGRGHSAAGGGGGRTGNAPAE